MFGILIDVYRYSHKNMITQNVCTKQSFKNIHTLHVFYMMNNTPIAGLAAISVPNN